MFVWLNQTVLSFLEHLLYTYYTPCFKEGGLVATKEAIVKDQVCSTVFNSIVDRHRFEDSSVLFMENGLKFVKQGRKFILY